jgi:hypothetical protein
VARDKFSAPVGVLLFLGQLIITGQLSRYYHLYVTATGPLTRHTRRTAVTTLSHGHAWHGAPRALALTAGVTLGRPWPLAFGGALRTLPSPAASCHCRSSLTPYAYVTPQRASLLVIILPRRGGTGRGGWRNFGASALGGGTRGTEVSIASTCASSSAISWS